MAANGTLFAAVVATLLAFTQATIFDALTQDGVCLGSHYKQKKNIESTVECMHVCNNDPECYAVSVAPTEDHCLFFRRYLCNFVQENAELPDYTTYVMKEASYCDGEPYKQVRYEDIEYCHESCMTDDECYSFSMYELSVWKKCMFYTADQCTGRLEDSFGHTYSYYGIAGSCDGEPYSTHTKEDMKEPECMMSCESDDQCYGFAYDSTTMECHFYSYYECSELVPGPTTFRLFNKIGSYDGVKDFVHRSGFLEGVVFKTVPNVNHQEARKACSDEPQCEGFTYYIDRNKAYLQRDVRYQRSHYSNYFFEVLPEYLPRAMVEGAKCVGEPMVNKGADPNMCVEECLKRSPTMGASNDDCYAISMNMEKERCKLYTRGQCSDVERSDMYETIFLGNVANPIPGLYTRSEGRIQGTFITSNFLTVPQATEYCNDLPICDGFHVLENKRGKVQYFSFIDNIVEHIDYVAYAATDLD